MEYTYSKSNYIAIESLSTFTDSTGLEKINFFTQLADLLGRVVNNFKTYIFKGFKKFKRSELKEYVDSHGSSFNNFIKAKAFSFEKIHVPIPGGMINTYPEVSDALIAFLDKSDFDETIKKSLIYFNLFKGKITEELLINISPNTEHIADVINVLNPTEIHDELIKPNFADSRERDEKLAGDVIGTNSDLIKTHKTILSFEKYYILAGDRADDISSIEKSIDKIISKIKLLNNIDDTFLENFQIFVQGLAAQLDMFGTLLDFSQRVEHNYVLSIRRFVDMHMDEK